MQSHQKKSLRIELKKIINNRSTVKCKIMHNINLGCVWNYSNSDDSNFKVFFVWKYIKIKKNYFLKSNLISTHQNDMETLKKSF
jgi:hypothetical protein